MKQLLKILAALIIGASLSYNYVVTADNSNEYRKPSDYTYGLFDGKPIKIPVKLTNFPPIYQGQDPWKKGTGYGRSPKPGESLEIRSFSLNLEHADLLGESELNPGPLESSPFTAQFLVLQGFPEDLKEYRDWLFSRMEKKTEYINGFSEELKLYYAKPANPELHGRQILYWRASEKDLVDTLIKCSGTHSITSDPNRLCTLIYKTDFKNVRVELNFRHSLLGNWVQLKKKTQDLLISFFN